MNHVEALQGFAAEKYLLNELPAGLRDEFEEHFFECQECALEVRVGAAFIGQTRTELQSALRSAPVAKRRSFLSMLALPLAGALVTAMAIVVVYQNAVTLPRLRGEVAAADAPAVLQATSLIGGASRGTEVPTATVSTGQPLLFYVDVPTDNRFSSYRLAFHTPSGSVAGTIHVSPEQARNSLLVRLPASEVHSGIYTLAVEGMQESGGLPVELVQYRFRVQNGD